jgi:hypothetical protein
MVVAIAYCVYTVIFDAYSQNCPGKDLISWQNVLNPCIQKFQWLKSTRRLKSYVYLELRLRVPAIKIGMVLEVVQGTSVQVRLKDLTY